MLEIFKSKQVTVEEIHAEFDSAEQRILEECDNVLNELKIPTETAIERKAKMLTQLGFTKSETVSQAKKLVQKAETIKNTIRLTKMQADYIRELKVKYPVEKFITTTEMNRICEKYRLIQAPCANYTKDIPEKNVLEMANAKPLKDEDSIPTTYKVLSISLFSEATSEYRRFIKDNVLGKEISEDIFRGESYFEDWISGKFKGERGGRWWFSSGKVKEINKQGLYVAAPNSHFDLSGLSKTSQYGFSSVKIFEIKDPVVFQYCKNDICRIITKWGTDDDKSYLDPSLFNEQLN